MENIHICVCTYGYMGFWDESTMSAISARRYACIYPFIYVYMCIPMCVGFKMYTRTGLKTMYSLICLTPRDATNLGRYIYIT